LITISFDETHHIDNGKPLYSKRFKRVMSFHNGIAPVEGKYGAFFIDLKANQLFNRVFKKAYGFYENKSAVEDSRGWFHIDLNGRDLYEDRYSWVGNFGENRAVVRDFENNYFHIDGNGDRVYREDYRYTGDFKYGIAVVVDENGKSTHIDNFGKKIHNRYFDELGIFHKGYAVAKDRGGYFHIDKSGRELYSQRYQKLEDFYNGSALATTFDGCKIVLNETTLKEMRIGEPKVDVEPILDGIFSYFKYQILFAILKLDLLKDIKIGREIELPPLSKKLIYRWLYVEKIIDKNGGLTELGDVIEGELKDIILYWQDLPFKTSSLMVETLKSGEEQFSKMFNRDYFNFLKENMEYAKLSQKMSSYYTFDYLPLIEELKLTNEVVCDIGGGDGKLLRDIESLYPEVKTILADKFIDIEDCSHVEVDFFRPFTIDSDIFILSRVLHDWNDERAEAILRNIRENMKSSSMLYIFETIVPDDLREDRGVTLSFHLLNFLGGYERGLKEFKNLFNSAGLKIVEVIDRDILISIIKVSKA